LWDEKKLFFLAMLLWYEIDCVCWGLHNYWGVLALLFGYGSAIGVVPFVELLLRCVAGIGVYRHHH
jgi:hypothetical protein